MQNKFHFVKEQYILFSIIIASVYGLLDEIHQSYIPGRSNDILDWVADTLGAITAVLLLDFLMKKIGYFKRK
jgi:VanZ family protein